MQSVIGKVHALQANASAKNAGKLPGNAYFLNQDEIVCYTRAFGDSRYPYTFDGLTLWAYASGNVKIEESAFQILLDCAISREPNLAVFFGLQSGSGFLPVSITGAARQAVESGVERYSVLRSLAAVERSRVCVIMIDATEGFTEQDSKVAGYAHEQGKACIIAVNKWDLVEKDSYTMDAMRKQLAEDFSFMSYAPILFISAKTGQRIDKLFETIRFVDMQNGTRIPTGALNEMLARATARVQPPSDKGKRLKIFYMTQSSTRPPTFVCFVNQKALFHFSYKRYLENQIRETFGMTGTPIRMLVREHGDGTARA